jgi:hypothetical protein
MDMELNSDQNALVDAVSHIVERHLALPKDGNVAAVVHSHYSDALDRDITEGGYLGIAREDGFGPLDAALLVEQVYRAPAVMEVAASAIVVPQLLGEDLPRPVALMRKQDLSLPVRFLAVSRTVIVDMGDDVAIVDVKEGDTESVKSIFAFPYGQFRKAPDLARARILKGAGAKLRLWWRVALAVEAAAAMEQAILAAPAGGGHPDGRGRQVAGTACGMERQRCRCRDRRAVRAGVHCARLLRPAPVQRRTGPDAGASAAFLDLPHAFAAG